MAPRLQFEDYLSALYVGSDLRNEAIEECIFIAKRGLSLKSECTSDILYWFLPLLQFITVTWESAVSNSFLLAVARSPTLLRFLGLSIHVCASTVLLRSSHLSRCNYDNSQYGRYVYALNPIIIFSCILSPVPSVLHLLIAVANYSSLIGYFIPLFTSLSLLVTAHSGFYSVIPAYFVLLNYSIREKGRKTTRDAKDYYNYSAKLFIAVSVIIAAAVMVHFSSANQCAFKEINPQYFFCLIKDFSSAVRRSLTSNMTANNQHSTIKYQPAAGVFWYFEAQLFSPFSEYFALLTFSQPFLFAVPLLVRFSSSRPLHTVTLTLAIVMFFRRETGISDIIFLATLLLTHHSDIIPGLRVNDDQSINRNVTLSKSSDTGMRFIPLIVLCVSVPIVLSPLMLSLWLGNASGNANFLFFQGFVLWVFYALAIIEFTNHTIRSIEEP